MQTKNIMTPIITNIILFVVTIVMIAATIAAVFLYDAHKIIRHTKYTTQHSICTGWEYLKTYRKQGWKLVIN